MIRRYKGTLQTWFGHMIVPGELYDIYETQPMRGYENCEVTVKVFGRSCPYSTRKIFNTIWEPMRMVEPDRDVKLS